MSKIDSELPKDDNTKTVLGMRFNADGKTLNRVLKWVSGFVLAVGAGTSGKLSYDAVMARIDSAERTMAETIRAVAPDKSVVEESSKNLAVMATEIKGIRSDAARDREEAQRNHVSTRGELSVLKGEHDALEKIVNELKAQGVNPRTVEKLEERIRISEQRIAALEAKLK